jgi:hypothetical protein
MSFVNKTINKSEKINDIDLADIETKTKLYNSKLEYIGDIGRFRMLDTNNNIEWVNIHNTSKDNSQWINGNITNSYKRGYVIENIIYKTSK